MDREIITATERRTICRFKTDVLSTNSILSADTAMNEFSSTKAVHVQTGPQQTANVD